MIAIGIGANGTASREELSEVISNARTTFGMLGAIATRDDASYTGDVRDIAHTLGVPFRGLSMEDLQAQNEACVTRSKRTMELFGVSSVCEAAALAAAGPNGRLIGVRRAVGNVTIAAARSADDDAGARR
jgi:cobalt-precorrin 5A hydrolase